MSIWQRAASFAARAHRHQLRKDGVTPYAAHAFRVAMICALEFGCDDERVVAAALLHDTIEDTGTDFEDLSGAFGVEVATIVAALTKNMALPESERERVYDAHLGRADWRAIVVKLADVIDNLSDAEGQESGRRARAEDRCRRALAIAGGFDHPVVSRAAERVRAIVGA